jgi:hemerythrin-like metal-binding protein
MLMPWSESNKLGIPVLDKQHRELYEMLNELNDAMAMGYGADVAVNVMDRLLPFVREHFEAEENILQLRHSPAYRRCCAEHAEKLSMLQFFLRDKNPGDPGDVIDLLYFLDSLLVGHIDADRQALGICDGGLIQ